MSKFKFLLAAVVTVVTVGFTNAQSDEITDENLRRYAMMMEVVDAMKSEISVITNDFIKKQEGIDGKRYLELSKGQGEAATEFEQKVMAIITEKQDDRKKAIQDVVKILASKMFTGGAASYKAIKGALGSDADVKARYDAILASIKMEEGA